MKKIISYIAVALFSTGIAFANHGSAPISFTIEKTVSDSPLIDAIMKGDTEVVKKLIASGANVNEVSAVGLTPLMTAVRNNQLDIVELLIAKGADLTLTNKRGMTALQMAERLKSSDGIIKALTDASKKV